MSESYKINVVKDLLKDAKEKASKKRFIEFKENWKKENKSELALTPTEEKNKGNLLYQIGIEVSKKYTLDKIASNIYYTLENQIANSKLNGCIDTQSKNLEALSSVFLEKSFKEWCDEKELKNILCSEDGSPIEIRLRNEPIPRHLWGVWQGWFLRPRVIKPTPFHIGNIYLKVLEKTISLKTTAWERDADEWLYRPAGNKGTELLEVTFLSPLEIQDKFPVQFNFIVNREENDEAISMIGCYSGFYPQGDKFRPVSGGILINMIYRSEKEKEEELNEIDQVFKTQKKHLKDCNNIKEVILFAQTHEREFRDLIVNQYSGNAAFVDRSYKEDKELKREYKDYKELKGDYSLLMLSATSKENQLRRLVVRITELGIAFIKGYKNAIYEGRIFFNSAHDQVTINTYKKYFFRDIKSLTPDEATEGDSFYNYSFNTHSGIDTTKQEDILFFEGIRLGLEDNKTRDLAACHFMLFKESKTDFFDKRDHIEVTIKKNKLSEKDKKKIEADSVVKIDSIISFFLRKQNKKLIVKNIPKV